MKVASTKRNTYQEIQKEAAALILPEDPFISKLANLSALLHSRLESFWTGFYLVENDQLILGPFQGPVACTTIQKGKGVCGTSWAEAKSIVVPDVHKFPGHIACSAESNSEIVVPLFKGDEVIAVLDIDSTEFDAFDDTDRMELEKLLGLLKD